MLGFRIMVFKTVVFTGTFFFPQVGTVTEDINRGHSDSQFRGEEYIEYCIWYCSVRYVLESGAGKSALHVR